MGNLESLPPRRPPLAPRPEGLGVYEDMLASGEGTVMVLDRYMQWQKVSSTARVTLSSVVWANADGIPGRRAFAHRDWCARDPVPRVRHLEQEEGYDTHVDTSQR